MSRVFFRYCAVMSNGAAIRSDQEHNEQQQVDIPVGEILRRTRVHYNQSLMEVEQGLRIRASQLQAIEEGDFAAMPGRVYAIGFVRSYSEYLGLNGDRMVELFKTQYAAFRRRPSLNFPTTMAESKKPGLYIIMGSLIAAIVFIALWSMFILPSHSREKIPEVPAELMQVTTPAVHAQETEQIKAPSENATSDSLIENDSAVDASQVEFVITERSWIEIKNGSGKVVLQQILQVGDKYTVPKGEEGQGFTMSTGNAGGVTVFVGGKKLGVLGKPAKVKRDIPLQADALKALLES